MSAFRDRAGERYGRLTVIAHVGFANACSTWLCECDCGNRITVRLSGLLGRTKSCGCQKRESASKRGKANQTHGHGYGTPEYISWRSMKQRCENPKAKKFANYGGRGIKVCDRWRNSFENFLADMGPRPLGHTLDRYPDSDGHYSKENCRWATDSEQNKNRRSFQQKKGKETHGRSRH
jgi:hypothetical protein